ncbi:hypothetical protein HII17_00985 [Thalassotalea sp. M1531]|uniref:DUF4437 domain-containing protein n=1 Tax=Thalassotalea algicola TaxID=2716224 RepID=A0A7Y0Q5V2_9GAMM|nr:cupin domain-containing protein [Thalassotalea algicola]NMP30122.1 hypothetical protein [Thalassotalea algicola]
MSREHIEFIQSQQLEWLAHPKLMDVTYKVLSEAKNGKGLTALYTIPEGWSSHRAFTLHCDEELFVLHGELWINDVLHREGSYAYLPRHFERSDIHCSKEALVIRLIAGQDTPVVSFEQPSADTPAMLGVDTITLPWDHSTIDGNLKHLCASRKILRICPVTKAKTFLYSVLPQTFPENNEGKQEYHPTPEEALVLTGDLIGPHGSMRTGAYFWRPPMIPHGPFGSRTGCTCLIRFVGGEHINHWTEAKTGFSFEAPYQPILPDSLAHLSDKPARLRINF